MRTDTTPARPREATKFNARSAFRRTRKKLTMSLLWRRYPSAEPPDARRYLIALATCAERRWQLDALLRFAVRRWPVMAGELGADGMLRLALAYYDKRMTNPRFGKLLNVRHEELFAIGEAHGWQRPRQWCREHDCTDQKIAAEDRHRKKMKARTKRARERYLKDLLEGGSGRERREFWCKMTGRSARSWRRMQQRDRQAREREIMTGVRRAQKLPRVTAALVASCLGMSERTFYNRPPEWRDRARDLVRDYMVASQAPKAGRWLAELRSQMAAFCGAHVEVVHSLPAEAHDEVGSPMRSLGLSSEPPSSNFTATPEEHPPMIEAEAGLPKASGRDRGAVARRVPRVTAVSDDLLTVPMDDDLERQSRLRDGAPKPWGKASSSTG